ncbi:hypothetical protein Scep_000490 [Stephania cephalantha]|uniref:Fe2OG dioxygenase domain-containing protein n=1 Tax=Stephania cephalantha TaxID=152367 RepID=A0AAP0LAC9_9MAGN
MGEVDQAFVQAEEHRPTSLTITDTQGIPVIDLAPLTHPKPSPAFAQLVSQVGDACRDWGFFQVVNHGVPSHLLHRLLTVSNKFFALPLDEKRKVVRDQANPFGYYDTEHTKNVRDWKEVFDFTMINPVVNIDLGSDGFGELKNNWPQHPPEMKEVCEEYAREVERVCYKLLEIISLSLGLVGNRFDEHFKDQTNFIRLNHYPPCPAPELALGVGRHKDPGVLTLLYQDDVGGLDVKRKIDGEWIRVKPIPDSFIVNVGDIIQVWSNGKYESVEHRVVVNSERERFSVPFFFTPGFKLMVKPVEELIGVHSQAKYKQYSWGEFFMSRTDSNYKKLGAANRQISDFEMHV